MKIINAEDMIVGRLATKVAKMLLLGETIVIVNSEKAVMTGTKEMVFAKFKQSRERGIPLNGPYYPRRPEMILKRSIRGMLPYKQEKGNSAFKRLRCYISVPFEFEGKDFEVIDGAHISSSKSEKYVTLLSVSKFLGAKL